VALAAGAAFDARAAGARDAMTLGFTLYGAKGAKLDEFLPTLKSMGFDSVELCVAPGWGYEPASCSPQRRREVRSLLAETGLKLSSVMEHVALDGDAAAQKIVCQRLASAAEMGHALSPHAPPVVESTMGGKPQEWEQVRTRFRDALGNWASVAEQTKTVIAVKPHRFNAVNRPEQAVWLIQQIASPWIELVYDFGHFVHRGMTLDSTLDVMLPHTAFVHMHDTVEDKGVVQFVLPGESRQIDYLALFRRLDQAGYRGDACCEVSSMVFKKPGYDPHKAAEVCARNMTQALRHAGLRAPQSQSE
jgi:inosose dehydratase